MMNPLRVGLLGACLLALMLAACGGGGGGGSSVLSSASGLSGALEETGRPEQSSSPDWWLGSGGRFLPSTGFGSTILGALPLDDRWRREYSRTNPRDTDGGAHPQNLFRLVRRAIYGNVDQSVAFRVVGTNLSASPSRNASNGVFLFSHYQDEDNLYVAGLRVDGAVVVKRKYRGGYTTLGQRQILGGRYNRTSNPNLIPPRSILLTTNTQSNGDGSVTVVVAVDGNAALEARDARSPLPAQGLIGIRTDFMDVQFDGYAAN